MSNVNVRAVLLNLVEVLCLIGLTTADWSGDILEESLRVERVEDPSWADYISDTAPAYDERRGFPKTPTVNPVDNFLSQRLNFSFTGRGEAPFMAVLYQLLERETVLDGGARSGVRKQRACGGVLVASDRLITPCGCVVSYFATYYAEIRPHSGVPSEFPFDLGWATPGRYLFNKINRIYVQYGRNRYFTTDDMPGLRNERSDMHLVEKNEVGDGGMPLPTLTLNQECSEVVRNTWRPSGDLISVSQMSIEKANHALALVPFTPEIQLSVPGQFIPWPPKVFNDITTELRVPFFEERVVVSGMGFEKKVFGADCPRPWRITDDRGNDFRLDRLSINIPMKHCVLRDTQDEETCKRSFSIADQYNRLSCFCDLYEPKIVQARVGCKVICNGTIGWPILYHGNVVALTVSPRNPYVEGNRLLGSSLAYPEFQRHVEETLSQETIDKQRTHRPPMFREDVESWSVVFYDYPAMPQWYIHGGTTPKLIQFSMTVHLSPQLAVTALVPLVTATAYFA